jgi:hypothetical protein
MVFGSFLSGGLLDAYGWTTVSGLILVPVLLAMFGLLWLQRRPSKAGVQPQT